MNLSFAGCGFLGIYHIGVASCFRKYAPHLLLEKISGASAGAIAACCLICELPLGEITSDVLRIATEARRRSLGPFNPSFNIHQLLLEGFEKVLPDDAHIKCNGKLHISLTRVHDGKNVIVSQFDTREELIQALLASGFIPIFSGIIPPKFKGVRYMDGGFSNNLPTLDENTITVSPFCGESDICPRDDSSQLFHINVANTSIELSRHNIYRMVRILLPPKPEILSNMCKKGFDDALRFLHRNNLINCTRCLAVQSTFVVSNTLDENLEYDPQCNECKIHRQEALLSNMPETVLNVFQEVIDSANKGLLNWLFKHRGMKLLSVLSLPYTLPADIMYASFTKLMIAAPYIGNSVWDISKLLFDQLSNLLHKVNYKSQQLSAKIICQLAITEYTGNDLNHNNDNNDIESCNAELSSKNKMNLNFTLNMDDSNLPLNQKQNSKFVANSVMQRNQNLSFSNTHVGDEDTFEHILQVTSHHETIMAYYYLDENNKLKVTEIYDVTDSDSPIVQTIYEKENNTNLEYDDDDWNETEWTTTIETQQQLENEDNKNKSLTELSDFSNEDLIEKDTCNLFSDPESEWIGYTSYRVGGSPDDDDDDDEELTNRPESDQPNCSSINI